MSRINANNDIFIVDDDSTVRDALSAAFSLSGYRITTFEAGATFLSAIKLRVPASIIMDVCMPGRSGIDILKELHAELYPAPIFIISGQCTIPMAVDAIKNGAYDFIEKPFDLEGIVLRVREAIVAFARSNREKLSHDSIRHLKFPEAELLTSRENDVLARIIAGASNKEIGRDLGISHRTVEVHRSHIMHKLCARNSVDLTRIVLSQRRSA